MKISNSYHKLLLLTIALVLAFAVPLKAQDRPQDYLNAHNSVRITVGVAPLVWSETLAGSARAYAAQRRDCLFITETGTSYGQILVLGVADLSAEQAVNVMVNQKSDYSYATNTCRAGRRCDAYLQVVWRKTVSLGCTKVRCDNGVGTLTICNYDPAGNVSGERPF